VEETGTAFEERGGDLIIVFGVGCDGDGLLFPV